jgi:hypothetical protein
VTTALHADAGVDAVDRVVQAGRASGSSAQELSLAAADGAHAHAGAAADGGAPLSAALTRTASSLKAAAARHITPERRRLAVRAARRFLLGEPMQGLVGAQPQQQQQQYQQQLLPPPQREPASPRRAADPLVAYPHNVNLKNFLEFSLAPTLVYAPNFPRTPSVRISYILEKTFLARE